MILHKCFQLNLFFDNDVQTHTCTHAHTSMTYKHGQAHTHTCTHTYIYYICIYGTGIFIFIIEDVDLLETGVSFNFHFPLRVYNSAKLLFPCSGLSDHSYVLHAYTISHMLPLRIMQ